MKMHVWCSLKNPAQQTLPSWKVQRDLALESSPHSWWQLRDWGVAGLVGKRDPMVSVKRYTEYGVGRNIPIPTSSSARILLASRRSLPLEAGQSTCLEMGFPLLSVTCGEDSPLKPICMWTCHINIVSPVSFTWVWKWEVDFGCPPISLLPQFFPSRPRTLSYKTGSKLLAQTHSCPFPGKYLPTYKELWRILILPDLKERTVILQCVTAMASVDIVWRNGSGAAFGQIIPCGQPALPPSPNVFTFALLGNVNIQLPVHIWAECLCSLVCVALTRLATSRRVCITM